MLSEGEREVTRMEEGKTREERLRRRSVGNG